MFQFLLYVIPIAGVAALVIGLAAMISPTKMSGIFGIQVSGNAVALVVAMGVRDLCIGGAIFVTYLMNLMTPASWILLFLGVVSFSDFLCVYRYGSKLISYTHLIGAVSITAVSVVLLYFL